MSHYHTERLRSCNAMHQRSKTIKYKIIACIKHYLSISIKAASNYKLYTITFKLFKSIKFIRLY